MRSAGFGNKSFAFKWRLELRSLDLTSGFFFFVVALSFKKKNQEALSNMC